MRHGLVLPVAVLLATAGASHRAAEGASPGPKRPRVSFEGPALQFAAKRLPPPGSP